MQPEYVLFQIVFLPILVSVFLTMLHHQIKGKIAGWLCFICLTYILILVSIFTVNLFFGTSKAYIYSVVWAASLGLTFGFLADGLGMVMALTITLLSAVVAVYSIKYMENEENLPLYFSLYLLYTAGMLGTVLASDLIEFYVFFELMLIPSWALIHLWGTGERERIAFKYLIYTHVGALSLLIGILATGAVYGTFSLLEIGKTSKELQVNFFTAKLIVLALLVGLMVKLAIFPFHTWLPDAHAEAPTPISALLSPAMIGIGGYGIFRIIFTAFPKVIQNFSLGLSVLALTTMVYGGLMALAQDDIKRLLAYSSISQMGYLLFGLASMSTLGLVGSMFHYFSHGTSKAILFMVSGIFIHQAGTRSIKKLGGLASKLPYTSTAMTIAFLSISGVPPFNGFQSEWMIFLGAILYGVNQNQISRVIIAVFAVVASTLTMGYALWTIKRTLFGRVPDQLNNVKEASKLMVLPLLVLMVITVLTGIYPQFLNELLVSTVQKLTP